MLLTEQASSALTRAAADLPLRGSKVASVCDVVDLTTLIGE